MSESPTFSLPACPVCSHRGAIDRPLWKFASNSSARHGKRCFFFIGCRHAAETANPRVLYVEPADWRGVEADWAARAERLFAQKTAAWSDVAATKFRRELGEKPFLPGSTESMDFTPAETPAQHSNVSETEEEKHHGQ